VCSQQAGIPSELQKTSLNDAPQIASLKYFGRLVETLAHEECRASCKVT
jgi:hypothetical protein